MAVDSAGMRLRSSTNQTFVEFHECSFFSLNNISKRQRKLAARIIMFK